VEAGWMTGAVAPEDRPDPGGDPVLHALGEALLTEPDHLEGQRLKSRRETLLVAALAARDLREGRPDHACARLQGLADNPELDVRLQVLEAQALLTLGLATRSRLRAHKGQVRFLEINDVQPTVTNYLRGAYALGCTFRLVHARDRRRQLAELVTFLEGDEARQLLGQHLTLR